jgi:hypothetical protein
LEFPLVRLDEFDEQSGHRASAPRLSRSLETNPAQEFPSFGREIDPGCAVRAIFWLRRRCTGLGFQHDEKTSVLENFANCELLLY